LRWTQALPCIRTTRRAIVWRGHAQHLEAVQVDLLSEPSMVALVVEHHERAMHEVAGLGEVIAGRPHERETAVPRQAWIS